MQNLSFNRVLPWDPNPDPLFRKNGDVYLRIYEKGAADVSYVMDEKTFPMQNTGGDIFEAALPYRSGFHYIQILVEGREVLSPLLPIGFGCSRPYNYIDLEDDAAAFCALKDVPHGSVRQEYFFSSATGEWERCLVYTPPGYETSEGTIPVLYLQHGHGENEIGWTAQGRVHLILDNLLAEKKAVPFAVVMNNGMVQVRDADAPGGYRVDHVLFEKMLLCDVIPFIENKYHVGGSRERRGMAGLSMGSMQTSRIICRHPEMFSEVGLFSGFLHDLMDTGENASDYLDALNGGKAFRDQFHVFFRAIGEKDPFYPQFLADDALLDQCGVETTRKVYPGIHDWNVWRRCIYDFSQLIFQSSIE